MSRPIPKPLTKAERTFKRRIPGMTTALLRSVLQKRAPREIKNAAYGELTRRRRACRF